jgi:hypothetical protein
MAAFDRACHEIHFRLLGLGLRDMNLTMALTNHMVNGAIIMKTTEQSKPARPMKVPVPRNDGGCQLRHDRGHALHSKCNAARTHPQNAQYDLILQTVKCLQSTRERGAVSDHELETLTELSSPCTTNSSSSPVRITLDSMRAHAIHVHMFNIQPRRDRCLESPFRPLNQVTW